MNPTAQKVYTIEYVLKNDQGEVIDATPESTPFSFIHGTNQVISGLEEAIEGKKEGDDFNITIPPEKGYGTRNENLIQDIPLKELDGIPDLKIGMMLQAHTPNGVEVYQILSINSETATLDANHPLAGENLHFSIKVKGIRDADEHDFAPAHSCCGGAHHGEDHECSGGHDDDHECCGGKNHESGHACAHH
jgi:FKBP-type peptidyl-prolyl cis-trans isomerase SlyD